MNADDREGNGAVPSGHSLPPRVQLPADEAEVVSEQLEYLLDHVAEEGICGCSDCQRYIRARAVLLEIFADPERPASRTAGAELPLAA